MVQHRFLIITLGLLLLAGLLLAGSVVLAPAQASKQSLCEPVEDVNLSYTPTEVYLDSRVVFTSEVISGSLPVTYTWDFGDGSDLITDTAASALFTVSHSYTATGVYSLTLTTWNTCTTPPLTTTQRVTVTARPCITLAGLTLSYTPAQVYVQQEVLFAGELTTGTLPLTYTWDFGDVTTPVSGTAGGLLLTATHVYTAADIYTVTLSTWNACILSPTQEAITVEVAPCDVITGLGIIYSPTGARAGEVLTFSADVTGTSPWAFEWAFGDGLTGTGQVVTHAYAALVPTLTYTVVLTAGNPCSQQHATATVQLQPPPPRTFMPMITRNLEPEKGNAHLGYGANVASADHASYLAEMGFDWAKGFVAWDGAGVGPSYNWAAVDNQLRDFLSHVPNVLLRINGPSPRGIGDPPVSTSDLAAFRTFVQALAKHVSDSWRSKGLKTVAYEIWNEPNLDYEWGATPNAAQYTALLKAGYQGIKAGDSKALVVSGALATTGGTLAGSPEEQAQTLVWARQLYGTIDVVPDLTFLRQMYENGAKGYFDALGTHPYGGSYAPATPPAEITIPVYFRRAEEQRQVMLNYDDTSPMWATEFGWVVQTDCWLGEHEWMKVSEAKQAENLAAAYAYADENWPWMGPMFVFNLDFGVVDWYADCDPIRWYSILYRQNHHDPGNSAVMRRPAFYSLKGMTKNSAW